MQLSESVAENRTTKHLRIVLKVQYLSKSTFITGSNYFYNGCLQTSGSQHEVRGPPQITTTRDCLGHEFIHLM